MFCISVYIYIYICINWVIRVSQNKSEFLRSVILLLKYFYFIYMHIFRIIFILLQYLCYLQACFAQYYIFTEIIVPVTPSAFILIFREGWTFVLSRWCVAESNGARPLPLRVENISNRCKTILWREKKCLFNAKSRRKVNEESE